MCHLKGIILIEEHKSLRRHTINTALRKLAEGCEFQTITPGKILRNRLIFGIKDDKVQERLLRESNLTLVKTDEIGRAAESMSAKMKVLSDNSELTVSFVKSIQSKHRSLSEKTLSVSDEKNMRECWNCGRQHEYHKKELYPAFGKICRKCRKPNHFSAKCCGARPKFAQRSVRAVDEGVDEVFPTQVSAVDMDDSQFVTLKLESGNYLRFQVDTGAQCNVLPLPLYKKATKDIKLANVTPHTAINNYSIWGEHTSSWGQGVFTCQTGRFQMSSRLQAG